MSLEPKKEDKDFDSKTLELLNDVQLVLNGMNGAMNKIRQGLENMNANMVLMKTSLYSISQAFQKINHNISELKAIPKQHKIKKSKKKLRNIQKKGRKGQSQSENSINLLKQIELNEFDGVNKNPIFIVEHNPKQIENSNPFIRKQFMQAFRYFVSEEERKKLGQKLQLEKHNKQSLQKENEQVDDQQ